MTESSTPLRDRWIATLGLATDISADDLMAAVSRNGATSVEISNLVVESMGSDEDVWQRIEARFAALREQRRVHEEQSAEQSRLAGFEARMRKNMEEFAQDAEVRSEDATLAADFSERLQQRNLRQHSKQ